MLEPLSRDAIDRVFAVAGLPPPTVLRKAEAGFSNEVYFVDDAYVLKAGKSREDDAYLKKEIYLVKMLSGMVPAPVLIYADESQRVIDRTCIVYEKIEGDTLYQRWHEYPDEVRRRIVAEICRYLKAIAAVDYASFVRDCDLDVAGSWRSRIATKILANARDALKAGSITDRTFDDIADYCTANESVLDTSTLALTYFDVHFDNFLVQNGSIVGMLDFERTDVTSIDYVLDTVARMVREPAKYASEAAKPLIAPADYAWLMEWYQEYYPETFAFPNLDTRLRLYSIEYDLELLRHWPTTRSVHASLTNALTGGALY